MYRFLFSLLIAMGFLAGCTGFDNKDNSGSSNEIVLGERLTIELDTQGS